MRTTKTFDLTEAILIQIGWKRSGLLGLGVDGRVAIEVMSVGRVIWCRTHLYLDMLETIYTKPNDADERVDQIQ